MTRNPQTPEQGSFELPFARCKTVQHPVTGKMETPSKPPTLPRCPVPDGWSTLPLGHTADEEIARTLRARGITVGRSTITRARHVLGIPTFVPPKIPKVPKTPRRVPVDWNSLPLGKIFDTLLAAHLNLSHVAVFSQRRSRGIPPAPRSLPNLLLALVQRRPGLRLRQYADSLSAPVRKAASTLESLSLVQLRENSLYPVFKLENRPARKPKPTFEPNIMACTRTSVRFDTPRTP